MTTGGGPAGRRGQTTVIGVALLLALVIVGTATVVLLANDSITDTQSEAQIENAEQAMTQLDAEMSLVAHGGAGNRAATIPTNGASQLRAEPSAGTMRIHVENNSGAVLLDQTVTLGAVVYEQGDTTVAYQGGGVWRGTDDGSVMVSPPEFDYTVRESGAPTLTLPLVTIDGTSSVGSGELTVSKTGSSTSLFPTGTNENPLANGDVTVTVQSDYYLAWGKFFEERTDGTVTYDHANRKAEIELTIPRGVSVPGGLVTGASTLTLENTGTLDSYDSRDGPYSVTQGDTAVVMVNGSIKTQNAATIKGTVQATETAEVQNSIDVYGPFVAGGAGAESEVTNGPVFRDVFSVQGDAKIDVSNPNEFRDDVIVGERLTFMKQAEIDNNLYVGEDATIDTNNIVRGDVIVGGDVTIEKNTQIDGTIEAGGNVTLKQGATPDGDIVAGGTVIVKKNAEAGGDVHAGGEIELGQNAVIAGTARAGPDGSGDANGHAIEAIGSNPEIQGDAIAEATIDPGVTVDGASQENTAVPSPSPSSPATPLSPDVTIPEDVNDLIDDNDDLVNDANNDNGAVGAIDESTDTLQGCGSTCTLPSGDYYLDDPTVGSGETLDLDTSDGEVTIYVDGEFAVDGGTVNVTGDERVSLYLDDDFKVQGTGSVTVPDDRSPALWAFMRPSGQVTFQNQATFQGVVFGPPSSSQDGVDVTIQNQAELYGAVVGNTQSTSNNNEVHYDEALASTTRIGGSSQPRTTFLHISTSEVRLES